MVFISPPVDALLGTARTSWRVVRVTDEMFPDFTRIAVFDGDRVVGAAVDEDRSRAVGRALGEAWERTALSRFEPGSPSVGTALAGNRISAVWGALTELAERHALAAFVARPTTARQVDIDDDRLVASVRRSGLDVDVWMIGTALPVAVVVAVLVNRDGDVRMPGITAGSAAGELTDAIRHAVFEAIHTSGFVRQLMALQETDARRTDRPAVVRALAWSRPDAVRRYDEMLGPGPVRDSIVRQDGVASVAGLERALQEMAGPVRIVEITPPELNEVASVVRVSAPDLNLVSDDDTFACGSDPHFFV